MRFIFVGPNGIRVGWRLLLFLVIFGAFGAVLQVLARSLPAFDAAMRTTRAGTFTPLGLFGFEMANFLAAIAAMAVMAKVEHRRLGDYGLKPLRGATTRLVLGFVFGLVMVAAICTLQSVERVFSLGPLVMAPEPAVVAGVGWLVTFLLLAVAEESVFRGYTQFTLMQATGFWPAAVALSLLFGVGHISSASNKVLGIVSATLLGLFSAFCLRRTGDLWLPIGIHAAFDYAEFFIFYAPSGGHQSSAHLFGATRNGPGWLTGSTIGPEASVNGLVVLAVAFIVVAALCKTPQPVRTTPD